jgi:hypothetical protein
MLVLEYGAVATAALIITFRNRRDKLAPKREF